MTEFLYYPGCSMESSAKAYQASTEKVAQAMGLHLQKIDDWNCCGATEYFGIHTIAAYSLIGRNLALASSQANGLPTVIAPCSACHLNLAKVDHYMQVNPIVENKVNTALEAGGLHYKPGSLGIRHLLDVTINEVGLEVIDTLTIRPLKGLRLAPYYGCMVSRPDYDHRWSDPEFPTELDRLLEVLGAEVVDFPLKTRCCGGHMTHIGPETAFELIRQLLHSADQAGADLMVTLCPMCQLNIDAYQHETNQYFKTHYHVPILFFTQLIGLAFGFELEELGIGSELVDARPALGKIGQEPAEKKPARGRRSNKKAGRTRSQRPEKIGERP